MGFGEPKMPTPEEMAKMQKERTINDAKMLVDGAEYVDDGQGGQRLEATSLQVKQAAHEMKESKNLEEAKNIYESSNENEQAVMRFMGEYAYLSSIIDHLEGISLNMEDGDVNGEKLDFIYTKMKAPLDDMLRTVVQLAENQNIKIDPTTSGRLYKDKVMGLNQVEEIK